MKIARIRHDGADRWAVVDVEARQVRPVHGEIADWGPAAAVGRAEFAEAGSPLPLAEVRLLPPVTATSTVVGVGMNYWIHLEKLGMTERPKITQCFFKPRSALIGPEDEIEYPAITEQLDYEVELVAVLARPVTAGGGNLTDAVLGYTAGNDTSARDTPSPMGGRDLFSMKSPRRSTPIGPWIVTKDEFGGSGQVDVAMSLSVNGELRQHDRTANMIFSLDECIDFVGRRFDLDPGDVLFTGTTSGVALEDGRWLQPGDIVEVEIERIGRLRNVVSPRRVDTEDSS